MMIGLCPTAEGLLPTWTEADRQAFYEKRLKVHGSRIKLDVEWRREIKRERNIPKATREQILERECLYCGGTASEADHYIPVSRGGLGVRANLVPACHLCNASKADLFIDEWQARREELGQPWPPPNTHDIYMRLVMSVLYRLEDALVQERMSPSPTQEFMTIVWTFQRRIYNGAGAWNEAKAALVAYVESLPQQAEVQSEDGI